MHASEIPGKLPHMMMSSHVKIHCINKIIVSSQCTEDSIVQIVTNAKYEI